MAELIDISNEKFWDILFDEACVEGQQAERIEKSLKAIATTEAEIRAKAISEFAERCKELVKQGELYDYVRWCNWNNSVFKWFDRVAEQLKEE